MKKNGFTALALLAGLFFASIGTGWAGTDVVGGASYAPSPGYPPYNYPSYPPYAAAPPPYYYPPPGPYYGPAYYGPAFYGPPIFLGFGFRGHWR